MTDFWKSVYPKKKKPMQSDFYLDFVPAPAKIGRLLIYAILKWPKT